jgi:peptide/nickel transport system ATP-binding protein
MTAHGETTRPVPQRAPVPIIEIESLSVAFGGGQSEVRAVDDVSLDIQPGEILALVGESGCGKSTLAYSLVNLVPEPGRVVAGQVRFKGRSMTTMRPPELRAVRGGEIGMVFQAAMNALNPVLTVGTQVGHILDAHPDRFKSRREGFAYFEELLRRVRLEPSRVVDAYESQLSGGMKQRTCIALGLLLKPEVLVLDEPTTALDVLNQRLVLEVLGELRQAFGLTIMFVTHDLGIVAELADRVAVMYAGRLVDVGGVDDIFYGSRRHPYVGALVDAIPSAVDLGREPRPIGGQVPNLLALPGGCRFSPRCRRAVEQCRQREPVLLAAGDGHLVACHLVHEEQTADAAVTEEAET